MKRRVMGTEPEIWLVSANGTLGDALPLIATAVELKRLGRSVRMFAVEDYRHVARRHGIGSQEWESLEMLPGEDVSQAEVMNSETGQRWLHGEWIPLSEKIRFTKIIRKWRSRCLEYLLHRSAGKEVPAILCDNSSISLVRQVCAETGAAHVVCTVMPYQPSATFSLSSLPRFPVRSRILNRLHWRFLYLSRPRGYVSYIEKEVYHLLAVSPVLFPRPEDWASNKEVTGTYTLTPPENGWKVPPELEGFLASGPPPAYVGFGSYPFFTGRKGALLFRRIALALEETGLRGILCTGSSLLDDSLKVPSTIYHLPYAPHDDLLKRCGLAIHHGGYGTTFTCLSQGKPMIIYPFQTDQFLWARRVAELGAGPRYEHRIRQLRTSNLVEKIRHVESSNAAERARKISRDLRRENGSQVQAKAVASIIDHHRRGRSPLRWAI